MSRFPAGVEAYANQRTGSDEMQTTEVSIIAEEQWQCFIPIVLSDAPTRPSFRSSPSQFSQMGNFRHQSSRTTERDRDRDSERDRQRDERDREGQERLRNVCTIGTFHALAHTLTAFGQI